MQENSILQEVSFSIILPVYNNVQYISLAIESFLAQNYLNVELIIIDGSSTDGTVEVILDYSKAHKNIRWISEPDSGQSEAMNKGIAMAHGEYISFLNSDDYYSPNTFREAAEKIYDANYPDFIVGNCHVWDNYDNLIYINRPRKLKIWHLLSGFYLPVNPSAYFYKKSLHDRVGLYNLANHHNMDIEFLLCVAQETSMLYVDKDWGNFRMINGTKTVTDKDNGMLNYRKKELYQKVIKGSSFYVKSKIWKTVVIEFTERKLRKFKKNFLNLLEAIYLKSLILLNIKRT